MAKHNNATRAPVAAIQDAVNLLLNKHSAALAGNTGLVTNLTTSAGLESYSTTLNARTDISDKITQDLRISLAKVGLESLTAAQVEAGAIVAMAMADPAAYSVAARGDFGNLESGCVEAPMNAVGAGFESATHMGEGFEYFNDGVKLDTHMSTSLVFNVQAARQNRFSEGFFRTITLDPSDAGFMVDIEKTMIHRGVKHAIHKKDTVQYNRRNILDAASDHTVLEDDSVRFIPYMVEDGSADADFVPASLITPVSVPVGNYTIRTNPLRVTGNEKYLMSLSAHPGLVGSGVLDESDEFDGRFSLARIYFSVKKAGASDSTIRLIAFNTDNLARASFNKTQEGGGREMSLEFRGAMFKLNENTKDTSNQTIEALQELAAGHYTVKISVNCHADVDLQTGRETMSESKVRIEGLYDADNQAVSIVDGAGKAIVESFELGFYGYTYKATRSNANRRAKGLLSDHVTERERYKIQLGTPITSRKPIGRADNGAALNDLITIARMRNDNLAITKLLDYTTTLKQVVDTITDEYELVSIEGAGRHYIRPWFEHFDFDVAKQVAALETVGIADNLRQALLTVLRNQIARCYRVSRFQPALEMLSGYTMDKPKVIIGTDVETANWLWQVGDLRTLGDGFEYEIVTTNDKRFKGRIQWVFQVGTEGYNPLNFGNFLWIPELVTDTNMTRNDAVANEITVQPRCYHVVNCPITGVINVQGLSEFVTNKPAISVETTASADSAAPDTNIDTGVGTAG